MKRLDEEMELGRMLGEPADSADYWEGWRRVAAAVRKDAEIMEWCAGSVRDRMRRKRGKFYEDAARLAAALDRIGKLLGSMYVRIESQEILATFLREEDNDEEDDDGDFEDFLEDDDETGDYEEDW